LVPLLRGGADDPDRVVVSYTLHGGYEIYAVVRGRWKLVVRMPKDGDVSSVRLYDLDADPDEETDLGAAHPERVDQLMAAYRDWRGREDQSAFGGTETEVDPLMQEQLRRLGYVE
jgi:arylsulfatase A-like enzyme